MESTVKYCIEDGDSTFTILQAKEIIEQAQKEALYILERARQRGFHYIKKIRKRRYDAGYNQGINIAKMEETSRLLAINKSYKSMIRDANLDCLNLLINIIKEVMSTQIDFARELLSSRICKGISELLDNSRVVIKVNPLDQEYVMRTISEQFTQLDIKVISSQEVRKGDAILSSESGTVELDLELQLKAIKDFYQDQINRRFDSI